MHEAQPTPLATGSETHPLRSRGLGAGGARPGGIPPQDLRETRHLLALTIVTGLTLGIVVFVFFEVLRYSLGRGQGDALGAAAPACQEGDDTCGPGNICQAGRCIAVNLPAALPCQDGDTCGVANATCTCDAPMRCVDATCVAPTHERVECEDPDVRELLTAISSKCDGDFLGCPESDLSNFVISSRTFDSVLAKFPDTLTVHFPGGKPPLGGKRKWPNDRVSEHYRQEIATPRAMKAMREARVILLIARSSAGGVEEENRLYSRRRGDLVRSLILKSAATPAEQAELEGKIKHLILGSAKILMAKQFAERLGNRMVGWGPAEQALLRAQVAGFSTLAPTVQEGVSNLLNQVVFVVPITCDLPKSMPAGGERTDG